MRGGHEGGSLMTGSAPAYKEAREESHPLSPIGGSEGSHRQARKRVLSRTQPYCVLDAQSTAFVTAVQAGEGTGLALGMMAGYRSSELSYYLSFSPSVPSLLTLEQLPS